jgi:hypothetical protein
MSFGLQLVGHGISFDGEKCLNARGVSSRSEFFQCMPLEKVFLVAALKPSFGSSVAHITVSAELGGRFQNES